MNPPTVVILSKTASNLVSCIAAVRQHEPEARIIVVDDGVDWDQVPADQLTVLPLKAPKPFIFARNANIGIRAAGDSDVVLLNDDALLESPGGFSLMQQAAEEHSDVGVIGAVTNVTGASHQQMRRRDAGFRYVDHIAFVCVLIPLRTRRLLSEEWTDREIGHNAQPFTDGLLDERYITYGWEDNDYLRQCKTAGLKIAVHDGCFVNHSKLPSTFRSKGGPGGDIEPGRKIYQAKWGKEFNQ